MQAPRYRFEATPPRASLTRALSPPLRAVGATWRRAAALGEAGCIEHVPARGRAARENDDARRTAGIEDRWFRAWEAQTVHTFSGASRAGRLAPEGADARKSERDQG